jgi:hypothetical protein
VPRYPAIDFCNTLLMYLAVDDGRCKQADIVKAIATSLQDGSVVDMNTSQYGTRFPLCIFVTFGQGTWRG